MEAKKCIFLILTFIVALSVSSYAIPNEHNRYARGTANKSHHLIVGSRLAGDKLVLRQNIQKNSSWMQVVVVEKTFNTTQFQRITQIAALDQKTNGNGAYASLTKGGPGTDKVTLKFKSQRGHGINFIVELYAR
ncbi:probable salivary secreted peptide [Leptopilina heterotoma]|uniref:probable salivary secreted peptide n=1 Tax=Leptopilina heterotoma TaxID=63436 RepID=UPI001CA977EE|nr:probable salivary secreted peptide [Leptopilina heterotoma]